MSRVTAARPAIKVPRSSEAAEPARSSRSINPGYVLSGLLALAVVLLVWSPWKKTDRSPGPIVRSSISLPRTAPVSGLGIAVSPDGKYLVYTAQSGQLQLYRLDLASSQPIPGAFGSVPAFSPDGQWVVFYSLQGKIEKVPLTGSAPEEIYASQSFTPGFWWTPDNTILFGNYSSGLGRIPLAGGTPEAVTTLDSAAGEISHRFPQLLPDGKTVIYTAKTKDMASFDEALVVAQRLDGTKRKVLVKGGYYGRYLPSGHLVYLRGTTAFAVQFDPEQMELIGSPVQVEQGGALDNGGTVCLGISTSGVAVFAPASSAFDINSTSLVWLDQAGSVRPLYDTLRNYAAALLSPDGQKVAVGIASANDDIWIYDIPRGLLTRLTYGWGNNNSPVWSADGSSVIYSAEKGQTANLYRKPWDGSGGEERLTVSANPQTPIDVTPDGKFLSFDENGDIWILPLDSAGASGRGAPYPFLQTPALETGGVFSRDGKWLVYTSDESGKPEVYVVSFPKRAGKQQLSNGGGFAGGFSRDGKQFFYGAGGNLMVIDVNAGSRFDYSVPRKFCTLPPKVDPKDIALDGKRILALLDHAKRDSVLRLDVVTEWFEVVKAKTSPSSN
jgi:serine/threonine-protein kinase